MSALGRGLYVRKPSRSRTAMLKTKHHNTKKKKVKEKPPWDSSTKDLTIYKPSTQELKRNHDLHMPKKDHERVHYKPSRSFDYSIDSFSLEDTPKIAAERKGAIVKEVFHRQQQELKTVLRETDETIASVGDLFGDDVQRYRGNPIITKAPNTNVYTNSFLEAVDPEKQTPYDKLSASVMQTSALNSISSNDNTEDSESDVNEFDGKGSSISQQASYQPRINLLHYENIARQSVDTNDVEESNKSILDFNTYSQFVNEIQDVINTENNSQNNRKYIEKLIDRQDETNTKKISKKRHKRERFHERDHSNQDNSKSTKSESSERWTFNDMKEKLDELDKEILAYEMECGKGTDNQSKTCSTSNTLSGYTMRLLATITRTVNHLKESERQLRAEMAMRKGILDAFEEQRLLIDSLTNDLIETQNENEQLKEQLELLAKTNNLQFQHLNGEISMLKKTMNDWITSPNTVYGQSKPSHGLQRAPLADLNYRVNQSDDKQNGSYDDRTNRDKNIGSM